MHTHQLSSAKAPAYTSPRWLQPYRDGTRIGRSQAMQAYAEMYCTDGSADTDGAIEELIGSSRTPMIPYASRTGTKRNLDAMRANGWGLLVSAKGVLRTEGFPYAWTTVLGLPSPRGRHSTSELSGRLLIFSVRMPKWWSCQTSSPAA